MANYRPKSLSELNTVYDKAMRAEKAIKEGSDLLSVPESEAPAQSDNIFLQLETKAQEAESKQVFDPDITNIANDFLRKYAQPEKPKAPANQVKRPAPTIQSVYHTPAKPRQEEKQDVSLSMGTSLSEEIDTPAGPLHKPAPTMPAVQPAVKQEPAIAEAPVQASAPVEAEPEYAPVPEESPATTKAPKTVKAPATNSPYTPPRAVPSRVRVTSTERNELFEEYMRVMSDDDDEPSERKPLFSFFKKKKKAEEESYSEPAESLYEELPEEEEAMDEVPVVAFDHSDVKYTDEYSDTYADEEAQEDMNIYDYIAEDFDYAKDDEDSALDMSFVSLAPTHEEITHEAIQQEVYEADNIIEEAPQADETALYPAEEEGDEEIPDAPVYEEAPAEAPEAEILPEEESVAEAEEAEAEEESEEVVYPEEAQEDAEAPQEAPHTDMVFEDVFSVSDESKRSHTGGNWEEVFGSDFKAETEEAPVEEYPEYAEEAEEEEYAEAVEEQTEAEEYQYAQQTSEDFYEEDADEDEAEPVKSTGKGFIKFLAALMCIICILGSAATLLISSFLDVNSGNLVSEKYRVFSVPEALAETGLEKDALVITENSYAHADDLYIYKDSADGSYKFGKVISSVTDLTGDYIYVTKTEEGTKLINRDSSMGVIIATYSGIGGILALICQYYILISAALIIIAVAMIALIVVISKKKADDYEDYAQEEGEEAEEEYSEEGNNEEAYTEETSEEEEDNGEYYTDYDTDGIEQGLFSDI